MQKILSFNTIFLDVNVILQDNNKIITSKKFESNKQSEILVSSLEQVLSNNGLVYNDIDIFSTIVGPGNFTGIKTSLAVLKALQITTHKKIITTNVFEIVSHNTSNYDTIILNMGSVKYYIKDKNENYYTIYKKEIKEFLNTNKNIKILTNDFDLEGNNISHSEYTNEKWAELVKFKTKNNIFTEEIKPLYIEEATITKRKN